MSFDFVNRFNPFKGCLTKEELDSFRNDLLCFFQEEISNNIDKWDMIIKVDRKGILIFDDLVKDSPISDKIMQIPSFQVSSNGNGKKFENKRVLLFDDSIRTGNQIRTEIDKISKHNIKSLSVATILANVDTYENLKNEYKNVEFLNYNVFNKDDLSDVFTRQMTHYFDYICMPQTKDLKVVKCTFPFSLSKDEILRLFDTEQSKAELEETKIEYNDRFKMVLDFSDKEIDDITKNVIPSNINLKLDTCKIRFFVHLLEFKTEIYIEYIINPVGDLSKCNKSFKHCLKQNKDMDESICLVCAIFNLTNYVEGIVKKNLITHNRIYEYSDLTWTFILNIK